ncbi:TPA: hypothetical protein ACH3X1_000923 [Trebouxia sp. C0004]
MSSKFHKQQQKAQWSATGTRITTSYIRKLTSIASGTGPAGLKAVAAALNDFCTLQNSYVELDALKQICGAVSMLPATHQQDDSGDFQVAVTLILDLLFFANSRPLHRQVLSWCRSLPAHKFAAVPPLLVARVHKAVASSNCKGPEMQPIAFAEPMLSLLEFKPVQLHLRDCSIAVTQCLSDSMHHIIRVASQGAHIPPSVMHSAQDAIAAIYCLLHTHGSFMAEAGAVGHHAICAAAEAMITSLKGSALAREAMSSAAVTLYAAAVLPGVPPAVSATDLASGLFLPPDSAVRIVGLGASAQEPGIVAQHLTQRNTSLSKEMQQFSFYGHVCAMKGLLQALPEDLLCAQLQQLSRTPVPETHSDPTSVSLPQQGASFSRQGDRGSSGAQHIGSASGELQDQGSSEAQQDGATRCSGKQQGASHPWLLLSDGALPACCAAVQQSTDAHHKFHAVSALAYCLDKIKQCLQAQQAPLTTQGVPPQPTELGRLPDTPDSPHKAPVEEASSMPILAVTLGAADNATKAADSTTAEVVSPVGVPVLSEAMRAEIIQLIWANFEDSLIQTVRQVQAAFEALLDILELQSQLDSNTQAAAADSQSFLHSIASTLLAIGSHRKGRYIPLAALVRRVGASQMLSMQSDLLKQTLEGMQDDAVGSAAATLLHQLLLHLKDDLVKATGSQTDGLKAWRQIWIPILLEGLSSPDSHLRHRVSLYAVPVPLGLDQASVLPLLHQVLQPQPRQLAATDTQVATLVAILKTARQMGLYLDLGCVSVPGEGIVTIPERLLQRAVASRVESLQVDALQLACVHPRTTSLPGDVELGIIKQALVLGMRCSSTSMRNKWSGLLPKLLLRVLMSVHAALNRQRLAVPKTGRGPHVDAHAQDDLAGVRRQEAFMQWLSQMLLACLYPGAPYERKYMAILLLNTLLEVWNTPNAGCKSYTKPSSRENGTVADNPGTLVLGGLRFNAFCDGFFQPQTTKLLLGAAVDSWDRLRDGAVSCLMKLPSPLPGLETPEALLPQLHWACRLLRSPRVRESDAGSRLVCMVYEKYVLGLGWHVQLFPQCKARLPEPGGHHDPTEASVIMLSSLSLWLQADIKAGQADLFHACRQSLAHGVLLALHYLAPLVPWAGAVGDQGHAAVMRPWLQGLLQLLEEASELALQPLSKPQDSNIGAEEVDADDMEAQVEVIPTEKGEGEGELAPQAQVILTGCWLTMKEVSLLMGSLATYAPLPAMLGSNRSQEHMLEPQQLADMGSGFLHILTTMKHNGAIDKTQAGFTALVQRILLEASSELNRLPQLWLSHLLDHMQRPGQSRDDIVRRSAGLPAAFVALFTAEPTGHPKTLLYTGMRELLRVAGDESQQKPWARVHAINTLRLTFSDRNLANDVSGFFAEGLQVAIIAMGGSAWEVRNAASLVFTALLIRMLGFRNLVKGESARRAITGAEFFNRYPSLHHFLLTQLQAATHQLEQGAAVVHPSLTPVLALLSRLRPSLHNQSTLADDSLSPVVFTEAVQHWATASQMAVRHLAAAALAPLTPPEELAPTLLRLLATATASPAPNLNLVHGCLSQAKVLLEINAQAVGSIPLLNSVLQALQSSTHLMQLTAPCAAIRNEATLLAAAALALPGAPETPTMVAYAQQVRQICWQSILRSSAKETEPFSRLQESKLHSGFQGSGERQPSEANGPSLEGQVKGGDRQPARAQGPNLDGHNDGVPLDGGHPAQTLVEHDSTPAQSAGVQQPNKPSHHSGLESVSSDAADPMMSLWLKNVTLLFFGHDLQQHLMGVRSSNSQGTACSLREVQVQVALESGNYDVRAACLKALVRRNAAGEALPAWLPVLLKQRLLSERHHKVLRRLLQLVAALPRTANSTCHSDNALLSPALMPSSAAGQTSAKPATTVVITAATRKAHGYNNHAVHAERVIREYEQVHRLVATTRHPPVSREGLQCLGAALQPVTAILTDLARMQQTPAEPQAFESQPIRQDPCQAQGSVQHQMPPHSSASGPHQAQLSGSGNDQIRSSRLELHQVRGPEDDPAQPANPPPSSHGASDASGPAGSEGALEQALHEMADGFISLVSRSSHAQQFDDIRLAAAVALEASGLLGCQAQMHQPWQGSSRLTAPALQAWIIVVRMMEDEDGEVRAAASGAAGDALQALGDEGVSRGAHVELVLRHAFDLLGSCCMHLPAMQQHMLNLLYRLASICITSSYFFMSVAPRVYMAGWSCACSLHMHLKGVLAWLPFHLQRTACCLWISNAW